MMQVSFHNTCLHIPIYKCNLIEFNLHRTHNLNDIFSGDNINGIVDTIKDLEIDMEESENITTNFYEVLNYSLELQRQSPLSENSSFISRLVIITDGKFEGMEGS